MNFWHIGMNDEEACPQVFKREILGRHKGEQLMIDQGDKRIQKPLIDFGRYDLDSLISRLSENCFVRGFGIGTVCATAFWSMYLW